jgi:hypothetical protein
VHFGSPIAAAFFDGTMMMAALVDGARPSHPTT